MGKRNGSLYLYPKSRSPMKLDILAIAAHPDDVDLCAAGTLAKHIEEGRTAGIIDLTRGELGTRGTPELRLQEAEKAAGILRLSIRDNLGMADGFFRNDPDHQIPIIQKIRQYRPSIVLTNAMSDRHPDHGRAAQLVSEACFYSGLIKVETSLGNEVQKAWRPNAVYHFIQDRYMKPDVVVNITDHFQKKMEAIRAFASQFHQADSDEPETPLSRPDFMDFLEARSREFGRPAGFTFGEGFVTERPAGIEDLLSLQ